MAVPFLLRLYQRLTLFLKWGAGAYVHYRLRQGKEDPKRLSERFGKASQARPKGMVAWFHGASVGETVSLLPVLQRIRTQFSHITPLITTGTVTAAAVITKNLPQGCIHQYNPWDVPDWVNAFLNHWQPDIAVFVESEFWPNLILNCQRRKIPLYLINACLSEKSYRSWQWFPSGIRYLLSCFDLCLAQSDVMAERLTYLGVNPTKIQVSGNLKFAASPLPHDTYQLKALRSTLKSRPLWVAASTHAGEETIVAEVHQMLKHTLPNILTILIPRHPSRANDVFRELTAQGLQVARRSVDQPIEVATDIYLVDTMGELGLFYRLSDIVFLGGTFVPVGGHNPIEPILLDCALIWGPYTHKQTPICDILQPAAYPVATKEELANTIKALLKDPTIHQEKRIQVRQLLATQAHVLEDVVNVLQEKLAA